MVVNRKMRITNKSIFRLDSRSSHFLFMDVSSDVVANYFFNIQSQARNESVNRSSAYVLRQKTIFMLFLKDFVDLIGPYQNLVTMQPSAKILDLVISAIKNLCELKGSTSREILRYISYIYDVPSAVAHRQVYIIHICQYLIVILAWMELTFAFMKIFGFALSRRCRVLWSAESLTVSWRKSATVTACRSTARSHGRKWLFKRLVCWTRIISGRFNKVAKAARHDEAVASGEIGRPGNLTRKAQDKDHAPAKTNGDGCRCRNFGVGRMSRLSMKLEYVLDSVEPIGSDWGYHDEVCRKDRRSNVME